MQMNIQGVEHDLQQIDSRLYNNKDTQRVLQELGSKYMNEQQQLCNANFVSLRRVYYIIFKTSHPVL